MTEHLIDTRSSRQELRGYVQRFRELERRLRAAGGADTSQLIRAVAIEHLQQAIDALEFAETRPELRADA